MNRKSETGSDRAAAGKGVALSRILPRSRFFACDDVVATALSDDAARCRRGDVFVARLTARGDGHDQVHRAIARGAAAVVADRMVPTAGTPLCLVPDSDWAHARLAHALAGDPARRMHVIAITGTSGKTTTAWLTAAVLAEAGLEVGVLSDLGCLDASGTVPEPGDYATAPALAAWLRRLATAGCTHAVVEVSSRMLADQCLAGIACDTVAVTNIGRAHLDVHGTAPAYRAVKSRILESLAADGCLVADGDGRLDRLLARAARRGPGVTALTAGLKPGCDLRGRAIERSLHGQTFLLSVGHESLPVRMDQPVTSFARDALIAAGIGLRCGVPLERIVRGIESVGGVAGRLERIDRGQDAVVFSDSPTSGHALSTTLASLRRLAAGRLVVIADEQTAGAVDRRRFDRAMARWCDDHVVVPDTMMDDQMAAPSRADLAAYARLDRLLSRAGTSDCVLVLGRPAGHPGSGGPAGMPLATVVEGWLRLAHPPETVGGRRRAA